MFTSNVEYTYNLLNASKKVKLFIYIGSSSEYGRYNEPIQERFQLRPTNLYEATKGCGSLLCQAFASQYEIPVAILRPFSLYGKYEKACRLFPQIYAHYLNKTPITLYPYAMHDWTYIADFIESIIKVIENHIEFDIINIGTGIQSSNQYVVDTFEKILEYKFEIKEIDSIHKYDTNIWVCDTFHAQSMYGIECKISLEEGIKRYINWMFLNY